MAGHLRRWNGAGLLGANYDPNARTRARRLAGRCTKCGKTRDQTGYLTCKRCRAQNVVSRLRHARRGGTRRTTPLNIPSAQALLAQMRARPLTLPEDNIALSGVTYGRQVAGRMEYS